MIYLMKYREAATNNERYYAPLPWSLKPQNDQLAVLNSAKSELWAAHRGHYWESIFYLLYSADWQISFMHLIPAR